MTCKTSYELHHNFPKLAHEAGFTFNAHRPRVKMDWNKLKTIDVNSVIKDRKFYIIEQHINDILDCVLESEFDMRILDEGVVKMFRMAQLAVEYHEFCRHYLDRSVYVLRGEIASLMQELNNTKKQAQEKDHEIKKIKKRSKQSLKTTGPYHNENIAALILRSLTNKGDVFQSTVTEPMQYNKCLHCDKVFVNNLYLQGHMTRRHPDLVALPKKNSGPETHSDNEKSLLVEEIRTLKSKLKQMEDMVRKNIRFGDPDTPTTHQKQNSEQQQQQHTDHTTIKEMKDVEVSTNMFDEASLLENLERWKKLEQQRHDQEVQHLKSQILETIKSLKEIESTNNNDEEEKRLVFQLKETIRVQNEEICNLKKELLNTAQISRIGEETESRKKLEEQMAYWVSKTESQSEQYDILVHKLNEVMKNAEDSRALAEKERQRADRLESLLEQTLQSYQSKEVIKTTPESNSDCNVRTIDANQQSRTSLGELQHKAQKLLEISSSCSSESCDKNMEQINAKSEKSKSVDSRFKTAYSAKSDKGAMTLVKVLKKTKPKKVTQPMPRAVHAKRKKSKILQPNNKPSSTKGNGRIYTLYPAITVPVSPSKVVRAKITEEVNNRLATLGVDPLKNKVPHVLYQKQRIQVQHLSDKKIKENPLREKIKYEILEHLNLRTAELAPKRSLATEYTSPSSTTNKPFNLYTVLSNVKTKALSLVMSRDHSLRDTIHRNLDTDITKRATMFQNTPNSPINSPNRKKKMSHSEIEYKNKAKNFLHLPNSNNHSSSAESEESISEEYNKQYNPKSTKLSKHETVQVDSTSDSGTDIVTSKSPSNTQKKNSIDNLIKSPARRPASASAIRLKNTMQETITKRSQSVINLLSKDKLHEKNKSKKTNHKDVNNAEPEVSPLKNDASYQYNKTKGITKSVLKNASSTSSLNKKKVLFDMDAIQMKSVSASPDTTPCMDNLQNSDDNKLALGLVHVDGEEWDISSIETEDHIKNFTKNSNGNATFKDLKQAIESQLARRNNNTPSVPVGGVDVLKGPQLVKPAIISGSNTSLGSSILDESEANQKVTFKSQKLEQKDDSEIEISEISMDGGGSKNDF